MNKKAAAEDKEDIEGGPGEEGSDEGAGGEAAPDPKAAPKLVTVNYGGKTFKVSPDVKATMDAQAAELEKARKERFKPDEEPPPKKKAVAEAAGDDGDPDDLMYTNPKKFRENLLHQAKTEVMTEVRTAYAQEQSQKAFWDNFNKANPDLEEARDIADGLLKRNFAEWSREGLTIKDTITRLADKTRDRIDALTGGKRSDSTTRKGKKVSEGGDSTVDRATKGKKEAADDEDDAEVKPRTTAQILKARKEARQQLNRTQH